MNWINEWKRGGIYGSTPTPRRRAEDGGGARRYDDLGPLVSGPMVGMPIMNPENLPKETPDKMERCRVLTPFCIGNGIDARPGDVVELPRWRARYLARKQTVAIELDELDERVARIMQKAERQHRLEQAAAAANPPPAAPPGPSVRRDSYGTPIVEPAPDPERMVRVRTRIAHCIGWDAALGKVRDVEVGEEYLATMEDAERRIRSGRVELVRDEPAKPAAGK